jgi:hypothetical protein
MLATLPDGEKQGRREMTELARIRDSYGFSAGMQPRHSTTCPKKTNTKLRSRLGWDKPSPYVGEGFMPSR